jgi:hypothetical protein
MDAYMVKNRFASATLIKELRGDFLNTLKVVEGGLDDYAFHRWLPERSQWRQQILASLYDAQMFSFQGCDYDAIHNKRNEITKLMKSLFIDSKFRRAIDAATNTPSYFRDRISILKRELNKLIAE